MEFAIFALRNTGAILKPNQESMTRFLPHLIFRTTTIGKHAPIIRLQLQV